MKVIILTKSSKHGKLCVSGLDIEKGNMLRFGIDEKFEISNYELLDKNGNYINIGDILYIEKYEPYPIKNQPENIIVDFKNNVQIIKNDYNNICRILESKQNFNSDHIFFNNMEYITEHELKKINNVYSLIIIKVSELLIYTNSYNKTKANFLFNSRKYTNFSVTDQEYFDKNDYLLKNAYLIISIPDNPYPEDKYYKFIAKIFPSNK